MKRRIHLFSIIAVTFILFLSFPVIGYADNIIIGDETGHSVSGTWALMK